MDKVRMGIVGLGGMGSCHAGYLGRGEVPDAELTAVCDTNPDRLEWAKANLPASVQRFGTDEAFFASGAVDAFLIATPHYDHPPLAIEGFKRGLHVLSEKPAGVYTRQVREMNEAAAKSGKVFGLMFNQRTLPLYQKIKEVVASGELGALHRTNWIITCWFRSQSYYDSGGWRATWSGEGGGVLLNQCPHNLDLWQWTCGMPNRVRAFCGFGKYHDIEVEDDVTAYVEYENGATGVFVTTTGEAPGTNRYEIVGDRGNLVVENDTITFYRNRVGVEEFNRTYAGGFGQPEHWKVEIPHRGPAEGHIGITKNFVNTILGKEELLAPGTDGIKELEVSNAMLLSAWTDAWVDLPIDEDLYYEKLQEKIAGSTFRKADTPKKTMDVAGSFNS